MSRRILPRWVQRAARPRSAERPGATNGNSLARLIDELELALSREYPAFLRQVRRIERADTIYVLTTFALLAAGVVLVVVGAATSTVAVALLGVSAMLAAWLLERRRQQALRQTPRDDRARVDRPAGRGNTRHTGG
jgi:hypothetical protein